MCLFVIVIFCLICMVGTVCYSLFALVMASKKLDLFFYRYIYILIYINKSMYLECRRLLILERKLVDIFIHENLS